MTKRRILSQHGLDLVRAFVVANETDRQALYEACEAYCNRNGSMTPQIVALLWRHGIQSGIHETCRQSTIDEVVQSILASADRYGTAA